jgi:HSP20 family molecular chaperone IbpA
MATGTMTAAAPSTEREVTERAARTVAPRADVFETDTAFVILADMPGVGPDGVEVVADRHTLTVRGRVSRSPTNAELEHREFEVADYHRAFTLTEDLDTDRIAGTLRDGVLRVEIPKSESVQPKKIPVRAN